MRAYEAVFIFDPELSEDALEQLKERIVNTINSNGNLLDIDVWGKRKLTYPINKKLEGVYYIFEFMGAPTLPRELKRLTTITESIMRSMIVVHENKTKSEVSKETVKVGATAEIGKIGEPEERDDVSEFSTKIEEEKENISEVFPADEKNDNNEEESKEDNFKGD